ncbi:beta-sarcoglycan [Nilaparvata lugens]|uniref:beta-sarcoglycan n=1 Tax=Nilaparvata lugens TaxID=108931 RepID=UPI000B98F186|nr:beta-sarcoglycan [Nilaparvata lugens]
MTSQRESPASDIPSDSGLGTLSIRDKSLLKRNINRQHNNNMSAGYVPVHEASLHRTGLRGKKTWAFWTLVGVLSALASANIVLTVFILKVLRISHQAMEAVEIVRGSGDGEGDIVKMHGNIDLGSIYKQDGLLESFNGDALKITGDNAPVFVELRGGSAKGGPRRVLVVRQNETRLQGVESFSVYDGEAKPIFSTHYPNFGLPRGVRNIDVKLVETDRVRSPRDEGLKVRGEGGAGVGGGFLAHAQRVRLLGLEGTRIDGGKGMVWSADQTLHLHSANGSVVLKASGGGVQLDVKSMPIVGTGRRSGLPLASHYKVCVCMPQGKLFRVPVPSPTAVSSSKACSYVNMAPHLNPCNA